MRYSVLSFIYSRRCEHWVLLWFCRVCECSWNFYLDSLMKKCDLVWQNTTCLRHQVQSIPKTCIEQGLVGYQGNDPRDTQWIYHQRFALMKWTEQSNSSVIARQFRDNLKFNRSPYVWSEPPIIKLQRLHSPSYLVVPLRVNYTLSRLHQIHCSYWDL